jgi:hypothetical protein
MAYLVAGVLVLVVAALSAALVDKTQIFRRISGDPGSFVGFFLFGVIGGAVGAFVPLGPSLAGAHVAPIVALGFLGSFVLPAIVSEMIR